MKLKKTIIPPLINSEEQKHLFNTRKMMLKCKNSIKADVI